MPVAKASNGVKILQLSELADNLILRHLRVSVPHDDQWQRMRRGQGDDPRLSASMRCVAIVGAGASAELFDRGDALASRLEQELDKPEDDKRARRAELFRLERVYGLDPGAFETRLAALSRTPANTEVVRERIAHHYDYRHPTVLGYELLAHLLKHRFLDAIISFNFDELLDQSLDDELGSDGYRRIVSDRDTAGVVKNPDLRHDYLPLYIKLHGTASDPGTLRFTREAYYQLPTRVLSVVEDLLDCELGVVVNVGSSMNGFDLHRLLRKPQDLEVYDLSEMPLSQEVRSAIVKERRQPPEDRDPPEQPVAAPSFALARRQGTSCSTWLKRLTAELACRARPDQATLTGQARFHGVSRHLAVAELPGKKVVRNWIGNPQRHRDQYAEYLRRRTILELAFAGAKARGLAQLSWLALDRSGKYFELYRREAAEAQLPKQRIARWEDLRAAAGLLNHKWLPDVVQSDPDRCKGSAPVDDQTFELRKFNARKLTTHLSESMTLSAEQKRLLTRTIEQLQAGSEVELQPTDDRVCSKAFVDAHTLTTVTALRVYTLDLLQRPQPCRGDSVHIACETGEWLLDDGEMAAAVASFDRIEILTAFELRPPALLEDFRSRFAGKDVTFVTIDPWRHNRHMTIICSGGHAVRAVYFARRLRTPLITPVYLDNSIDAKRVKRTFDLLIGDPSPTMRTPAPSASAIGTG
jgi:hypothetical protein